MSEKFPEGFMFGTATAAYQVEGAVDEDGRTPSIWDTFSHEPGHVLNGDTGDVADDFYHRWESDLEHARDLGVNAFRFSIGIPRIIPTPDGVPNRRGIDFYRRVITRLLDYDIQPVITLYHWDLPQYLGDNGGWLNRDTAYRIADYARIVAAAFADLVPNHATTTVKRLQYITLNEPWCAAHLSYGGTEQAPGLGGGPIAFTAAHHLNLAHGLMCQAIREEDPSASVAVTLNLQVSRGDADAVRRIDLISNRVFLDPMLRGYYPVELKYITHDICDWSFVQPGDLEIIHQPVDNLGLNYYATALLAMSDRPQFPQPVEATTQPGAADIDFLPTPGPHTEMGWNIDPDALHDILLELTDNYRVPLVVTENGMACADEITVDDNGVKAVHDAERIEYLRQHLDAVSRAIEEGADIRGYFAWSLLDNFEWAFGYAKRFGLLYVDYETQERTRKDSFEWYRKFIAEHEQ